MKILKLIWKTWKAIADWVLRQAFHLVLFIFYCTILVPFAFIFKASERDSFSPGWKLSPKSKAEDLY